MGAGLRRVLGLADDHRGLCGRGTTRVPSLAGLRPVSATRRVGTAQAPGGHLAEWPRAS